MSVLQLCFITLVPTCVRKIENAGHLMMWFETQLHISVHTVDYVAGVMTHTHCLGGDHDAQLHLKPCPITPPDRPGLPDFSRVHLNQGYAFIISLTFPTAPLSLAACGMSLMEKLTV